MKRFEITYLGYEGNDETTVVSAENQDEAAQIAKMQGLFALEIRELPEAEAPNDFYPHDGVYTPEKPWMAYLFGGYPNDGVYTPKRPWMAYVFGAYFGGVPTGELYHFTRLFGTLVRAGIPILESLAILKDRTASRQLQESLENIHQSVQNGGTLGAAFAMHPGVFDFTYQSLVRVGEESGELEKTLLRLADLLDKRLKLRRTISKAIAYPVLVLSISTLVTYGIMTYVVPRFKEIYSRFGGELPWPTQITMVCSDFLVRYTLHIMAFLFIAFILLKFFGKNPFIRAMLDRISLAVPLFGPMHHTFEIAQFSKSFSILIHSGVTVVLAMEILIPTVTRLPIQAALIAVHEKIKEGESIATSFTSQEPWFPDLFNRMIQVGERSGNLTQMLDHISDFYEEEFYSKVETLASLIEPILIVILGAVIGGIVVSLYLPIFGIAKLISKR